jgi:nucleotide-binding universal stress UspA family protein
MSTRPFSGILLGVLFLTAASPHASLQEDRLRIASGLAEKIIQDAPVPVLILRKQARFL